jgi:hypothetical protein
MAHVLVAGDGSWRGSLTTRLERLGASVDEGDPELGDVVMFVRLDGEGYDVVVFVGHADPVTRGALAVAADRAILVPLVSGPAEIDTRHEGYLFRLPRALAFRDEDERATVHRAVPKAADVRNELVGRQLDDDGAWRRLLQIGTRAQ